MIMKDHFGLFLFSKNIQKSTMYILKLRFVKLSFFKVKILINKLNPSIITFKKALTK